MLPDKAIETINARQMKKPNSEENEITPQSSEDCECIPSERVPEYLKHDRFTIYSDVGRKYKATKLESDYTKSKFAETSCGKSFGKITANFCIGVAQMTYLPAAEIVNVFEPKNNGKDKEAIDYAYSGAMLVPRIAGDVISGAIIVSDSTLLFSVGVAIACVGITFQLTSNVINNICGDNQRRI